MRGLMIGAAIMGLSPWLIPSIALAAKMTPEQAQRYRARFGHRSKALTA